MIFFGWKPKGYNPAWILKSWSCFFLNIMK